jgi:hypothetical protein
MMTEQAPDWAKGRLWLDGAYLQERVFSGRRLENPLVANGSRLIRCDFRNARIEGGTLGGGLLPSEYVECNFDNVYMRRVVPGRATFVRCSFRHVNIYDLIFVEAQFIDCVFSGLLEGVVFSATPWEVDSDLGRTVNEYRKNDFSQCRMTDVAFRGGIDLDGQILPQDPDYVVLKNANESVGRAREEIERWPREVDRTEADIVLRVLESELRTGQKDIFVTKSLLRGELAPEMSSRLLAALINSFK